MHPSLLLGESCLLLLLARVDSRALHRAMRTGSRALHRAMRTGSQVEDKLHVLKL